ncbi:hypothetical protein DFQ27_001000 [Actinomortierella ambigua]|uniref:Uncharacterized protein n=1 Tax=Actinomortierella ambigua TaxID=1343610 RepID=A0A9P6UCV1_9FUNG|nr:hypothetical protein DFQ27_001000 [Actinomortierella ambigua]
MIQPCAMWCVIKPAVSPSLAVSPPPDPSLVERLEHEHGIRPYFYHLDVHGQLFLHDTYPRNFTSCFKDPKFLDFFFSRIQPNDRAGDPPEFQRLHQQYPWISPCGKEMNFVEVADVPVVYHSLRDGHLVWAGTKTTPFLPDRLFVSESTGRIYHTLPPAIQQRWSHMKKPPLGLLKSSLVLAELVDKLDGATFHWQGKDYALTTTE